MEMLSDEKLEKAVEQKKMGLKMNTDIRMTQARWREIVELDAKKNKRIKELKKGNHELKIEIAELEEKLAAAQERWDEACVAVAEFTKHLATLDGIVELKRIKEGKNKGKGRDGDGGDDGGVSRGNRESMSPTPKPGM